MGQVAVLDTVMLTGLDGDTDDRKSTSGYVFQISGAAISWRSKKQSCVALCTAEAEYIALASAAQEAIWMRQLLTDVRNPREDQPGFLKITNQLFVWPGIPSFMDEPNTSGSSIASFANK